MARVSREILDRWHDSLCANCLKRKENFPKARCPLWYGLFVQRTKVAQENASVFLDEFGMCKGYDSKEVK